MEEETVVRRARYAHNRTCRFLPSRSHLPSQRSAPMTTVRHSSRRSFIRNCMTGALALGAGASPLSAEEASQAGKSRVVVAHDPLLRGANPAAERVQFDRVQALLDRGIQS